MSNQLCKSVLQVSYARKTCLILTSTTRPFPLIRYEVFHLPTFRWQTQLDMGLLGPVSSLVFLTQLACHEQPRMFPMIRIFTFISVFRNYCFLLWFVIKPGNYRFMPQRQLIVPPTPTAAAATAITSAMRASPPTPIVSQAAAAAAVVNSIGEINPMLNAFLCSNRFNALVSAQLRPIIRLPLSLYTDEPGPVEFAPLGTARTCSPQFRLCPIGAWRDWDGDFANVVNAERSR